MVTTTPKTTTSTTTVVRKGKGRGKKTPTMSVLDTVQDGDDYYVEIEGKNLVIVIQMPLNCMRFWPI